MPPVAGMSAPLPLTESSPRGNGRWCVPKSRTLGFALLSATVLSMRLP